MLSARQAAGKPSGKSSKGWPAWGWCDSAGSFSPPLPLIHPSSVGGYSSSRRGQGWNTPRESASYQKPERFLQRLPALQAEGKDAGLPLPTQVEMWPTATGMDSSGRQYQRANGVVYAALPGTALNWPTPTANAIQQDPERLAKARAKVAENGRTIGELLATKASVWPPAEPSHPDLLTTTLGLIFSSNGLGWLQHSRRLNPFFVEALMGLPPGWSSPHSRTEQPHCAPWETACILAKRPSPASSSSSPSESGSN